MKKKTKILIIMMIAFFSILITVNATTTNDVVVASDNTLVGDNAYISSVEITQTKTGTGPWDSNDEAGNDSSEDNNIVRSFDEITYTIESTMKLIDASQVTSLTGGTICIKAEIEDKDLEGQVKWDKDSMKWATTSSISDDGLTFYATYDMSTTEATIPGKQSLVMVLKTLGATNGEEITPKFTVWLDGNEESLYKTIDAQTTYISSTPNYNVKLAQNTSLSYKTMVDYDGDGVEELECRVYGYSPIIQLYNQDVDKGIKGIECPKGPITLQAEITLERTNVNTLKTEDITQNCTPILWDYKVNDSNTVGTLNRNMTFGTYSASNNYAPYASKRTDRKSCVYNSGNVQITQEGNILNITIDGYEFDGTFPIYNLSYNTSSAIVYTDNIGCFSSPYFQILVPYNEYSTAGDYNYYLTLKDTDFTATSASGTQVTTQQVETDDTIRVRHYIAKTGGAYNHTLYLLDGAGKGLDYGTGYATRGQTVQMKVDWGQNNEEADPILTLNKLIKFDADAYQITTYSSGETFKTSSNNQLEYVMYYVTKKDGTNWSSQTEMNETQVEDLNVYKTIEEIPDDEMCVGVYFESCGGKFQAGWELLYVPVVVKETAVIGQTYAFTQATEGWNEALDRDTYTALNDDVEWPSSQFSIKNRKYVKTEYDESGQIVTGTNNGSIWYGNTLLIVGAELKLTKSSIDDTGKSKVNYDFSKNEYDVTYKLSPVVTEDKYAEAKITGITLCVEDTLPDGMTYVAGSTNSTYEEPEVTENSDGTYTLKWYLYDVTAGENIEPITYKAHLNEELLNGDILQNSAIVSEVPEVDTDGNKKYKVGNSLASKRTSTNSIQIINLASYSLYKITDTEIIEKNGEIHFKIMYKNNTDSPVADFAMLDIMPYNGDSRGTSFSGKYTIDKVVVTQTNDEDSDISNDNLSLYTAQGDDVVSANVKDENLGTSEIWTKVDEENGEYNLNLEQLNDGKTAIVLKGKIQAHTEVILDIYLSTNGNDSENVYVNSVSAQTLKSTEEMTSSQVQVQVIERIIRGNIWYDENKNGIKDETENTLSDELLNTVKVKLYKVAEDESLVDAKDIDGNTVEAKTPSENGDYSFENLEAANYIVKVTYDDKYSLTAKETGNDTRVNSKFEETELGVGQTEKIVKLNTSLNSKIEQNYVNAGIVNRETKVITKYVDIDSKEEIYDEDTQLGNVEDAYETINELDNINVKYDNLYEYVSVDGEPTGNMTVDTITVTYYYRKTKGNITVTKVDKSDETKKISGATFKVEKLDDSGNVDSTFTAIEKTTDDTGIVKFSDLPLGKYRIEETVAPTGYELLNDTIDVEITSADNEKSIIAKDRLKLELPEAGGMNYFIAFEVIGTFAIVVSYVMIRKNRGTN